jgi:ABC-2 type transport system permease protein
MTPLEKFIGLYTIMRREIVRVLRIWTQTLLPPAITTSLYFVIFGHVIGRRIGDMGGYTYIQFIAPGLIMMSIITSSYASSVSSFFSSKFQRNIEEMLVSPMPNYVILLGFMMGGVVRGLLVGFIVAIIALFFTHLQVYSVTSIILVALLSAMIFSLAGVINAVFARKFDDIALVPTFILTPLTYLGGVFYSITLLPPVWRVLSLGNPIVYIVGAFRYGFLGVLSSHLWVSYVMMALFVVVLYGLAIYLLRNSIGLRE